MAIVPPVLLSPLPAIPALGCTCAGEIRPSEGLLIVPPSAALFVIPTHESRGPTDCNWKKKSQESGVGRKCCCCLNLAVVQNRKRGRVYVQQQLIRNKNFSFFFILSRFSLIVVEYFTILQLMLISGLEVKQSAASKIFLKTGKKIDQ